MGSQRRRQTLHGRRVPTPFALAFSREKSRVSARSILISHRPNLSCGDFDATFGLEETGWLKQIATQGWPPQAGAVALPSRGSETGAPANADS